MDKIEPLEKSILPDWAELFPDLRCEHDRPAQDVLNLHSSMMAMKSGSWVFHEGDECNCYYLVIEGSVRVEKISAEGRELMLYRYANGEGCALSAASLISQHLYSASAVCESHVTAIRIEGEKFLEAVEASSACRNCLCKTFPRKAFNIATPAES